MGNMNDKETSVSAILRDVLSSFPQGFNSGVDAIINLPQLPANLIAQALGKEQPFSPLQVATRFNSGEAPQTEAGKYAERIGEYMPGALVPGGLARNAALMALAGGADEAAGQATEGTKYEPAARMLAGLLAASGGATLGKSFAKPAESFLSSRANITYNPPEKPQRPFASDYSGITDDGRITNDIEGRPIVGRFVAGRSDLGGMDRGVPQDKATLDEITTGLIGKGISPVAPREIGGDTGRFLKKVLPSGDVEYNILLANNLTPKYAPRVASHEIGHAIDVLTGEIPVEGLNKELSQVYNTLATGQERTRALTGPKHVGYSDKDAPREMMAEAIRAYMVNPNYLKTVAPKTAARIREYVNGHPEVSKIIQFNSIAALLGAPLMTGNENGRNTE